MGLNIASVLVGALSVVAIMLIWAWIEHVREKREDKREAHNKLIRDVRILGVHKDLQIDENHAISNRFDELSAKYDRLSKYCDELHVELFELKEWRDSGVDAMIDDSEPNYMPEYIDDDENYSKEFSVSEHVARREAEHDKRIAEMREANRMELYDIPHSIVDRKLAELPDVEETE